MRYTEEDAKNAFQVLTGRKKNVYIDIQGDPNKRNEINAGDKKKHYGAWAVFSVENLATANLALSGLGNGALNNLALETHGGSGGGDPYMRTDDGEGAGTETNIYSSEVNMFNRGSGKVPEVDPLKNMAGKIRNGGNLIIASCYGGAGLGGETFAANINALTGNRLNIFLPKNLLAAQTYQTVTGDAVAITRSFRVEQDAGWLHMNPQGQTQHINTIKLFKSENKPISIDKSVSK